MIGRMTVMSLAFNPGEEKRPLGRWHWPSARERKWGYVADAATMRHNRRHLVEGMDFLAWPEPPSDGILRAPSPQWFRPMRHEAAGLDGAWRSVMPGVQQSQFDHVLRVIRQLGPAQPR